MSTCPSNILPCPATSCHVLPRVPSTNHYLSPPLLLQSGGGSTLSFKLEQSLAAAAPYLVKAAPCAGFQGLHIECRGLGGQHMALLPSAALPSLPHVRRLTVQSYVRTAISLSLPMPRLECFQVFELEEELGPISADLVAIGRPPSKRGTPPAAPPFRALTRLQLDAVRMKLDCSAMPALAEARLTLVFPEAQLKVDNPSALTALTSLVHMGETGVACGWHGSARDSEWQESRQEPRLHAGLLQRAVAAKQCCPTAPACLPACLLSTGPDRHNRVQRCSAGRDGARRGGGHGGALQLVCPPAGRPAARRAAQVSRGVGRLVLLLLG